jgi:hypothetical protein
MKSRTDDKDKSAKGELREQVQAQEIDWEDSGGIKIRGTSGNREDGNKLVRGL